MSLSQEELDLLAVAPINGIDKVLVGDPAPNVITGGAGNDYVEGKAGADQLSGGGGTNTLGYESSSAGAAAAGDGGEGAQMGELLATLLAG